MANEKLGILQKEWLEANGVLDETYSRSSPEDTPNERELENLLNCGYRGQHNTSCWQAGDCINPGFDGCPNRSN